MRQVKYSQYSQNTKQEQCVCAFKCNCRETKRDRLKKER
jgi:hypothetical protein